MTAEVEITNLLEQRYAALLNEGDIEAYASMYDDDDVVWAVPNLPDATSNDQIRTLLGKILARVTQTLEVTVDDLQIDGDLAIATAVASGTAATKPDGDPQPLALRVIWVLRRRGGDWKITRQVGTPKPTP